ncbi:MAG TPA: TIGR02530 family flagellar biosynthesis protein [Lachnospiraceae bacterium]|nr:TIGR02530 family flagellar biosynthesis protein [Lachnospiraceae bacterium]
MKVQNGNFLSIEQLQDQYLRQKQKTEEVKTDTGLSFQEILNRKQNSNTDRIDHLRFSKHAVSRLSDRNIELTNEQMVRLYDGAKKAGEKGIQESLVIVDQLAFIVNIPNKTVVTAMDQTENQDNIFTNIDGAVIM